MCDFLTHRCDHCGVEFDIEAQFCEEERAEMKKEREEHSAMIERMVEGLQRIIVDPEWDWEASCIVNLSIKRLLWEKYGVGLDSVKVIRVSSPNWCVHVPEKSSFMPVRYRSIDKGGVKAWLWRFLGGALKKPRWVRRGRDKVMLEPQHDLEAEEIRLHQCFTEGPWGTKYRWWMGYGPKSKCLAIGDWKGSTDFVQNGKGETC